MLKAYAQKLLNRLPEERRAATMDRGRAVVNTGYAAYARPLFTLARGLAALTRISSISGTSIPRAYWHHFLDARRDRFRGRAVELDSVKTIWRYGAGRVEEAHVLDLAPRDGVDVVADLPSAWNVPEGGYDVFVNQFAIHMIERDLDALYHSIRLLRPGGTLLCCFPCASSHPVGGVDYGGAARVYVHRWYTPTGVERRLARLVPPSAVEMVTYGNRVARGAYALDVGAEALPAALLHRTDATWPVLVCAAVTRPRAWSPAYTPPDAPSARLSSSS